MRDALLIFFGVIIALVVGGYLYLNGTPTFVEPADTGVATPGFIHPDLTLIAEGQNAENVTKRTNYRVMNEEAYDQLWADVYGTGGPVRPVIDFDKYEIIAVFDGSHATGGYSVEVTGIDDADTRTIHIRRTEPGEGCVVTQGFTSPFQIVQVKKTFLPVTREEETVTAECA